MQLPARASLLLFGSGFCALVYQTVWLRELRLVFGASTAASAAVLGIFMAGLGAGGWWLGRRADTAESPLAMYARLEIGISVAAGASPLILLVLRYAYLAVGGTATLGLTAGTIARLLLSALVLGLPTFLMGGTLPAMVRAVERSTDESRRSTGLLYAANTAGAVLGVLSTTFFALEVLGLRRSLWTASLVNLLIALAARNIARRLADEKAPESPLATSTEPSDDPADPQPLPLRWLVLPAAGIVGFAFLLMELVWYRMLAPILGGSSYTFGLILAVALAGIALGGFVYASGSQQRRPTLVLFAGTCALEALCLILPFALGDRIAILALFLRSLAVSGFGMLVFSWTLITAIVVLPAAVVSGYQFPLLIAVLGRGRACVGRDVGLTYASNTAGAILGSIAGGFGLLPLLSAPGAWRAAALLLVATATATLVAERRRSGQLRGASIPIALAAVSLVLCTATGPTAVWRHSPIGAGRMATTAFHGPNDLERALEERRRSIEWETDGVESSVALHTGAGNSFLINGKTDGSARNDAPTQVMLGLVGALLHPEPRHGLVIGLGTGSSGGWLAQVPTMERVDVAEIEPAIEHVARECAAVNHDALLNPRLELLLGDGRELLVAAPKRYDVIASEPSNPYRAGIASLYSRDFYAAAAGRLNEGGIFVQWLQGYEVDAQLVRTVYATLRDVFPHVESWQIHRTDLLLAASLTPFEHDVERTRQRIREEPYKSALGLTWGVADAEGFYSAFIASSAFADAISAGEAGWVNTDDRPVLEFGFARNLGRGGLFSVRDLQRLAQRRGENRPRLARGELDWGWVREQRAVRAVALEDTLDDDMVEKLSRNGSQTDWSRRQRIQARAAYLHGNLPVSRSSWLSQDEAPRTPIDLVMVGEVLAEGGEDGLPEIARRLRDDQPVVSDAILGRWHYEGGRREEAVRYLKAAFEGYRDDPWPHRQLMQRLLVLAARIAHEDVSLGRQLYEVLGQPFAVNMFNEARKRIRVDIAKVVGFDDLCVEAIAALEPHVPWEQRFLFDRYECYRRNAHPLVRQAQRDLEDFVAAAPPSLDSGLVPAPSPTAPSPTAPSPTAPSPTAPSPTESPAGSAEP